MGALIVLILVTARRIRTNAEIAAQQVQHPVASRDEVPLLPGIWDDSAEIAARQEQRRLQRQQELAARQEQLSRQAHLNADWQARAALAQSSHVDLQRSLAAARQAAIDAQIQARSLDDQIRKLEDRAALIKIQRQLLEESHKLDATELAKLNSQEARLRDELEQLKLSRAMSRPEFQVVAFDPATGTTRRPILIECTAEEIRFGAERISLTAQQVNGYQPESNPLLAGTKALAKYWSQVDARSQPDSPPPYVLLLVRPQGTVGFYVARHLLEKFEQPFGYELVREDEEIRWPNADPGAVAACRNAVEAALAQPKPEPPRAGGLGIRGGEEAPFVADSSGNFSLPEVERLRRAPREGAGAATMNPEWAPQRQALNEQPNPLTHDGPRSAGGVAARSFAEEVERSRQERQKNQAGGDARSAPAANDEQRPEGLRNWMDDGGPRRKWGQETVRPPAGMFIGIEKEVVLHLRSDRISLENGASVSISPNMEKGDLQAAVGSLLDGEAKSWGQPPQMFEWRPRLTIVIHPGGNRHHARLKELLDHWGLGYKVERVLD